MFAIEINRYVVRHYNEIPFCCIKNAKSILDIGSSNGRGAKFSKYKDIFDKINKAGNYLGIDIQSFNYTYYNIIQQDLLVFRPQRKYDLVIASHVLEHLDISEWKNFFDKFFNCLSKKGYLIVITPFRQKISDDTYKVEAMQHKVFQIDKQLLERYSPNGYYYQYTKNLISSLIREENEFLPYTILRFFYRIITFHPYSIFKRRPSMEIVGIWKK